MNAPAKISRAYDSRLAHDRWRTWLPLAAVVLAVFALVALPIVRVTQVQPQYEEMRTLTEPSRNLLTRIHAALALEQSLLRDFVEGGDSLAAVRYQGVVAEERRAYDELAPLVKRLGPTVQRDFDQLRELERAWHGEIEKMLSEPRARQFVRDPMRARIYEDILLTAARLDEGLSAEAAHRRAAIEATNRAQVWITFTVGAIALATAVLIAWIGRRLRTFAMNEETARHALEEAVESRSRLMRGVTHDLRNPLQTITGSAEILAEGLAGSLNVRQEELVQRIRVSSKHLLSMISDLLELSMAEGGTLPVRHAPTPIADLLTELVRSYQSEARSRQLSLSLDVQEPDLQIVTDPQRVTQVLQNLISNAIKYTPSGGRITVSASIPVRDADGASPEMLVIDVADTGNGIPEEQAKNIFEEFTRLENHRNLPGSGLGLAIARRVAVLLGGNLTLASSPSGSVFRLSLPRDRRTAAAG